YAGRLGSSGFGVGIFQYQPDLNAWDFKMIQSSELDPSEPVESCFTSEGFNLDAFYFRLKAR
ncbi:MAG: hypothetical protein ACKOA8_14745, partial [Deltaproteobacteria bacterium]